MVNEKKVKQMLMKRRDEMDLEDFERHLRNTNRLYGTAFKPDDFVPACKDIFNLKI